MEITLGKDLQQSTSGHRVEAPYPGIAPTS